MEAPCGHAATCFALDAVNARGSSLLRQPACVSVSFLSADGQRRRNLRAKEKAARLLLALLVPKAIAAPLAAAQRSLARWRRLLQRRRATARVRVCSGVLPA